MRRLPLVAALLLAALAAPAAAQGVDEDSVYTLVEQMPELIGGLATIRPEYPEMDRRAGVEGRVILQFIVETDGTVSDITVVQSVSRGIDAAAVVAVESARFRPGMQDGRPARVRFALPINFRLDYGPPPRRTTAAAPLLADYLGAPRVLAEIPAGTVVYPVSCSVDWCAVEYEGRSGYVATANLTPLAPIPVSESGSGARKSGH